MEEKPQYWPDVAGGIPTKRFSFGDYRATLMTDLESPGRVQYLYVMAVFLSGADDLCLCVASETNRLYRKHLPGDGPIIAGGSHFLGLFPGTGHLNLGSSNDWADMDKFTARSLEVAREHLKVEEEAVEELGKRPWWRFW